MADLSDIFNAALKHFLKQHRHGIKAKVARFAGISPSHLGDIISKRTYGTEERRRDIAAFFGFTGRKYEDFLDVGLAIVGKQEDAGHLNPSTHCPSPETLELSEEESECLLSLFKRWGREASPRKIAVAINASPTKIKGIVEKGLKPDVQVLNRLIEALGLSRQDIMNDLRPVDLNASGPVPMIGLGACSMLEWHKILTTDNRVNASPISMKGDNIFAVVAVGDSMVPAGILPGHIAYCDAGLAPAKGDAVFIKLKDEYAALKQFEGWCDEIPANAKVSFINKDGHKADKWIILLGWKAPQDNDDKKYQEPYLLAVGDTLIDVIAPVIFVRRRV